MKSERIVIIGGGIIGLAIAIELRLRSFAVTVLSRNFQQAATHVAAGMIAPQAEEIPPSPMLDLCLLSRSLYGDWTSKLERISGRETGYWQCGILAPRFTKPKTTVNQSSAYWLDRKAILKKQPGLGDQVVGGWWFPEDSQVDNRRDLAQVLRLAAQNLQVEICEGVEAQKILTRNSQVVGIETNQGIFEGDQYVLATGAWSREIFPLPVYPVKGQMMSVRVPQEHQKLSLKQVLFGDNIYIVPRRDGLIVIGATVENIGFTPHNTPQGIQSLLSEAIRLYPSLKDFPIEEFWWGYRPATSDQLPILGASSFANLKLALGHYRNGILLAPVTAKMIADLVTEEKSEPLLKHFSWQRFAVHAN